MSASNTESGSGIPTLLNKLCMHLSKNDADVAARLFKVALTYLNSPMPNSKSSSDEQFVVAQIRKMLSASDEPSEKVQKFDLLYSSLQKSSIIKQKCSILTFLLNLGIGSIHNNVSKWTMVQELQQLQQGSSASSVKSQTQFALGPDNSEETIKKIFSGSIGKKFRSYSTHTQASLQATTLPWLPSENDLVNSSRSTLACSVTESELIQDVIYCFQGVDGRYLRREPAGMGYVLDPKTSKGISIIQRSLMERLADVGFLHNQLKFFCDNSDKDTGTISQALSAILREELADYYRIVAILQAQLKKQSCSDHSELTLRRMLVWVADHHKRFQWLCHIAEQCSEKKGGALISAVHNFLNHGSKCAQAASEKVLTAVCRPLYLMLSRWLLDGVLNDTYGEFFIEARSINAAERLWHDKYHVRTSMVPSFIAMDDANKILATGKSINFLQQICKDADHFPGRETFHKLFTTTTASVLFDSEQNMEFLSTLENVYKETSLRVLVLLRGKYRLLEHLQALRRYLLLGQGDFIRHLLELLAPELSKEAQELYGHTLTGILESAVRVTTAQYEDEDTLKRLNVNLMSVSKGDTGWDVFSLSYQVDGPVGTIFQPTMCTYKSLFGALWKAKRMEFVLSNMRKQQISISKIFRRIAELRPVMHLIHILASEMIHFLHQTQYYFLFEVLECSWADMLGRVNQAENLDDVIRAHSHFLTSVRLGVLLDTNSVEMCFQLRVIYNLILNLESVQENLYVAAQKERDALLEYERKIDKRDGFGVTLQEEKAAKERKTRFNQYLSGMKQQVKQLSVMYKDRVQIYLHQLSTSSNMNLQLLSVRLNFNDYYRVT